MARFRIGDKVILQREYTDAEEGIALPRGARGEVRDASSDRSIGVCWEGPADLIVGHDLNNRLSGPESNRGWFTRARDLRVEDLPIYCPCCGDVNIPDMLGLCPRCTWVLRRE